MLRPGLQPFVECIWATSGTGASERGARERVLPDGRAHVVFRLGELPLRLFEDEHDALGYRIGHAVVGGMRAAPYHKDVSVPAAAVGAILRPGAAEALLGVPGRELADRHTCLADLWARPAVAALRERLADAPSLPDRIRILEDALVDRVRRARGIHPLLVHALSRFDAGGRVTEVVEAINCSHRHFLRSFENAVGLTPKRYSRVRRFGRVLQLHRSVPDCSWAEIAAEAGFADQAHLHREFLAFAGVTPGQYRRIDPESARHVSVPAAGGQISSRKAR